MSFANPFALFGLAAVAVPIAVHLLARHRGPRTLFPTLRFLPVERPVSLRRYRLSDLWLLLVRAGLVAMAALALAGPRFALAPAALASTRPVRAIVVDTSASMSRAASGGRTALARARVEAARVRDAAAGSVTIDATDLREGMAGASAWLGAQPDPREVVIISDFQRGALSQADVAAVPAAIGITLVSIDVVPASGITAPPLLRNDRDGKLRETTPQLGLEADRTVVRWLASPQIAGEGPSDSFDLDAAIVLVPGPGERDRARLALRTVMGVGARPGSRERPLAIVFPGAAGRGALIDHATPLDREWMVDAVHALMTDAPLDRISRVELASAAIDVRDGIVPVLHDVRGGVLVAAAAADLEGARRLVLFVNADPGDVVSALVMDSALRAAAAGAPVSELEPLVIDPHERARWERPASGLVRRDAPVEPRGRWVWLAVIAGLALETWMRRDRPGVTAPSSKVERDRVA